MPANYLGFSQEHITSLVFLGTPHRGWRHSDGHTFYTHATLPQPTKLYSESNSAETEDFLPSPENEVNKGHVVVISAPPTPPKYVSTPPTPSTPGSQLEHKLIKKLESVSRQLKDAIRLREWFESAREGAESKFLESLSRDFSHELEVTHEDIVRYDDHKDPIYLLLEAAITKFVRRAKSRSAQSPEDNMQENSNVSGTQRPNGIQRSMTSLSLRRKSSIASASGVTALAAEATATDRKQHQTWELIDRYFPVNIDMPAEIAIVIEIVRARGLFPRLRTKTILFA
ncbi:hypothetical protein K440DRAFT_635968 [Wilcoxina mikolae CBS 423.85]|nr:hypothetical protein K440DRAFT_635968 [Wilcoxina mikolae CBS 423.85]